MTPRLSFALLLLLSLSPFLPLCFPPTGTSSKCLCWALLSSPQFQSTGDLRSTPCRHPAVWKCQRCPLRACHAPRFELTLLSQRRRCGSRSSPWRQNFRHRQLSQQHRRRAKYRPFGKSTTSRGCAGKQVVDVEINHTYRIFIRIHGVLWSHAPATKAHGATTQHMAATARLRIRWR